MPVSEFSITPFFVAGGTLTADATFYVEQLSTSRIARTLKGRPWCEALPMRYITFMADSSFHIRICKIGPFLLDRNITILTIAALLVYFACKGVYRNIGVSPGSKATWMLST